MREISKKQKCILLKNGIQIWQDDEQAEKVGQFVNDASKKFVIIDQEFVGVNEIAGIFSPQRMEEYTRRRNGQWQCSYGTWHERYGKCLCRVSSMEGEELARYSRGY